MVEEFRESIVVPAIGAPSCVTCLRSVGCRGIYTIAVSEQEKPPAFSSRYCEESIVIPSPENDVVEYKDALLSIVSRDDVRTIVPMREADVYVLSKYRSEFEAHVATLWPSFDTLRRVHDRSQLIGAAREASVAVPETSLLDEIDNWDRESIVKSRYVVLTEDYDESLSPMDFAEPKLTKYLQPGHEPDRGAIRSEYGHVPLVQEYVPGGEYAFWALYDRGEPVVTCQKRQLRAWSYAGGTSICRETVRIPELEKAGRALLDHLDWHGLASVQFIKDSNTGEFTLLEVNPRFWISLSCAVRAGADFPYAYWRLAVDGVYVDTGYEVGVSTHLPRGELVYLTSVLRENNPFIERPPLRTAANDVASSFYGRSGIDYFSLNDPRPYGRAIINAVTRSSV